MKTVTMIENSEQSTMVNIRFLYFYIIDINVYFPHSYFVLMYLLSSGIDHLYQNCCMLFVDVDTLSIYLNKT